MADPLTLGASAVGITSLAIQLLEKAKTVHDLWSLVRDAPAELKRLLEDLEDVAQLLQEVIEQATDVDPNSRALLFVRKCETRLDDLRNLVGSMDLSSGDGKRAFVKRVVKILGNDQKVLRMRNNLQEMIRYSSLALQLLHGRQTTHVETLGHRALMEIGVHATQPQQSTRILSEISIKSYQQLVQLRQELESVTKSPGADASDHNSDNLMPERGLVVRRNGVKLQNDRQNKWSRRHTYWRIPLIFGFLVIYQRSKRPNDDEGPDAANPDPSAKEYGLIFQPSWLFHFGFMAAFVSECNAHTYQFQQTLRPTFYLPETHPLFVGAENCDVQTVQHYLTTFGTANILCMEGDYVNDSRSLLQHAILHEQIEIVRILIENNADTDYADNDGLRADPSDTTYLDQNCWHSRVMSTTFWQVLAEGSVPMLQQRDIDGHTPLHTYCLNHNIETDVCRLAVRNGADINSPLRKRDCEWDDDWEGASPLHFAIISVQVAAEGPTHASLTNNVAEELLVDCFSELTDVHHCQPVACLWLTTVILADGARQNQKRKIGYLLENGANLHAISRRWGSPTDIAKLSNNLGMWYDVLKECNVELDAFLAKDSAMERTPEFYDGQDCVRERGRTRYFLQRQWLCIVASAEKVGLGCSDGIHRFVPSGYQTAYPRGHCALCWMGTGGRLVAACNHLYYLRFFVVVLLSRNITCFELGDMLEFLIIKLSEDLEEWVTWWYSYVVADGKERRFYLEQTSRIRCDSGSSFCEFIRYICQQDQERLHSLSVRNGHDGMERGSSNQNEHSDDGEHGRLKDLDTGTEQHSERREVGHANQDAGYRSTTEKQPNGDNEESDDGEEHSVEKEPEKAYDAEEAEEAYDLEQEYDAQEKWDGENWFMLQIIIIEIFFLTQWPRTIELDFKELSTKLRESREEPRIPGAWPADNE
ncbi:MAG: hypothetical protein M1836_000817 [Candelina mexicana]|nr:MAG: hypothetical protein M1836_000817 [Candelina mexicana]